MPAFYAHERFGRLVLQQLGGVPAEAAKHYASYFRIGLQGPDFLFYYKPWRLGNRVAAYGIRLHEQSARPFFVHAQQVAGAAGRGSAAYAYLLGFVCHYVLDSRCHPYVNAAMQVTGAGHLEIEEEFDKALLRKDGEDPLRWPIADYIPADAETAAKVSLFYPDVTEAEVRQALVDFKKVKRFLTAPGALHQALINTAMRLSGKFHEYKGLMMQRRDNVRCAKSNEELYRLMMDAIPAAVEDVDALDLCIQLGRAPGLAFSKTFEGNEGNHGTKDEHEPCRNAGPGTHPGAAGAGIV